MYIIIIIIIIIIYIYIYIYIYNIALPKQQLHWLKNVVNQKKANLKRVNSVEHFATL